MPNRLPSRQLRIYQPAAATAIKFDALPPTPLRRKMVVATGLQRNWVAFSPAREEHRVPRVYIPVQLRGLAGGQAEVDVPGQSVREVVAELDRQFPGLAERLTSGGELAPNLQVSIDGVFSRRGLDAKLQPQAEVHFLPVFGGG